jgi:hypothetical protein
MKKKCPVGFRSILILLTTFLSIVPLPTRVFSDGMVVCASLDVETSMALIGQVVPGVSVTWQPGTFGFGAEVDLPVDLAQGSTYINALVLGTIGWFRIGLGFSAMVFPPASGGPYIFPESPARILKVGLAIPGWKAGPGKIGVDVFAAVFETVTPGSGLGGSLLSAQNMFKVGIGVHYSVGF